MCSSEKLMSDNDNHNQIKITVINKPTKEQSSQKIKELSEFLSKTWHMPINSK